MRRLLFRLWLLIVISPVAAAAQQPGSAVVRGQPAQNLLGQFVLGWAAGFLAGYGGAKIGDAVLGPRGGEDPGLLGAFFGVTAGTVLGTSLTVHAVARDQGVPSEYGAALGGAVLGLVAVAPLLKLGDALGVEASEPITWALVFALPAAGAVVFTDVGYRNRQREGRIHVTAAPGPGGAYFGVDLRL